MLTAASSILLVYVVVLYTFAAVGQAIFGGTAHAAAACREAARCCRGEMHFITDDPPEQRAELLREALPGRWEVVSTLIDLEAEEEEAHASHEREYFCYTARRL